MFRQIFVCSLWRFTIHSFRTFSLQIQFIPEFKDERFTKIFSTFSQSSRILWEIWLIYSLQEKNYLIRILHEDFKARSDTFKVIFGGKSHHRLDFFIQISSSEFKRCTAIRKFRIQCINIFFSMCMIIFDCFLFNEVNSQSLNIILLWFYLFHVWKLE